MKNHNYDRKRRETEDFCKRFVLFWMFVCIAVFFWMGWPALVAWVGLFWGVRLYLKFLFGNDLADESKAPKKKPRCRK